MRLIKYMLIGLVTDKNVTDKNWLAYYKCKLIEIRTIRKHARYIKHKLGNNHY
jgi:hypothetical protein